MTTDPMTTEHIARAAADAALTDEEFRLVVRDWIAETYMLERNLRIRPSFDYARPWYNALSARGFLAPGWPVEHGGSGLSIMKQVVIVEEQERFGCCRMNEMGVVMVGPLLIRYGTPEQQQFFLPKILSGEIRWCQGYSEPGAGSDLASLRTEAVRDGDEWVVNGQKIWTTRANDATWIFALLRTDKTVAKHAGISMFLMPMDSPGITVKGIRDLTGGEELCHTFFENVRVPHANLVGELNKGWAVNSSLLGLERVYVGLPKHSAHGLARLHDLMTLTGAWDVEAAVDRFTQFQLDLEDHIALYEAALEQVVRTGEYPANISLLKLSQTELYHRITEAMMDMGGEIAGLFDPLVEHDNLFLSNQFLLARPTTIYGGTSEVQRNILATRVLGLPK